VEIYNKLDSGPSW